MIEPVVVKLIWLGAGVAAYGLFRWRWLIATQEFVIGAVWDAEQWARSPGASANAQGRVEYFANVAYRPFATCCVAVLVSLGVVVAVIRDLRHKDPAPARTKIADREALITFRLLVAVLATSPIALVLATLVFCIGLLFRGSVKAVLDLIPEAAVFGRTHQAST